MADEKPIIIVKKGHGHGGHHGGAWKVAYADFVTAMMAFFMVMWLVNSADVTTKQNIASYFRRPGIFAEGSGTPLLIGGAGILEDAYAPQKPEGNTGTGRGQQVTAAQTPAPTPAVRTSPTPVIAITAVTEGQGATPELNKGDGKEQGKGMSKEMLEAARAQAAQKQAFESIAAEIKAKIADVEALAKILGIVNVKVEADGLHIDIIDTEKTSMFSLGSSIILPDAREAFSRIGEMVKNLPNKIDIVGHTDAKPFTYRLGAYSNWELSADRANAARKVLEMAGVSPDQFESVVGRADRDLSNPKDPFAASNRRITLKMRFNINRRINIAKASDALDNLNKLEAEGAASEPVIEEQAIPGVPTPEPQPEAAKTPVKQIPQKYEPAKIIKAAKEAKNKIALPEEQGTDGEGGSPAPAKPGGGLFGDSPVVGPGDPLSGF